MEEELSRALEVAKAIYEEHSEIWCPYFSTHISLSSEGLAHLQCKRNRQPRPVAEQLLKLRLLKKALYVIGKAGTLQEYRHRLEKVGALGREGFSKTELVEYWAFHALLGTEKRIKIVVVLRRVGEGRITFWSVMPDKKFGQQKLYSEAIEDD
jgi:hypothetical protein